MNSPVSLPVPEIPIQAGMQADRTLLLNRGDVERLLSPDECIAAVEDAFRQHALGKTPAPGILGMHAQDGSFHIKADLAAGRLVTLLDAYNPGDQEPFHAVFVGGATIPARVRVFVDYLAERLMGGA